MFNYDDVDQPPFSMFWCMQDLISSGILGGCKRSFLSFPHAGASAKVVF